MASEEEAVKAVITRGSREGPGGFTGAAGSVGA